jgi:hypothetical protein
MILEFHSKQLTAAPIQLEEFGPQFSSDLFTRQLHWSPHVCGSLTAKLKQTAFFCRQALDSLDDNIQPTQLLTSNTLTMAARTTIPGATAAQILFLLRFIQQGSLVLTGFVACYFVYWHNALRDPVPLPLIALVAAVRTPHSPLPSILRYKLTIELVYTILPRVRHLLRARPHPS